MKHMENLTRKIEELLGSYIFSVGSILNSLLNMRVPGSG
jgi:hypothetical protein